MSDTITLDIPIALCPMSLSKNGRNHWRDKHRDFHAQKDWAMHTLSQRLWRDGEPWPVAVMHIEWQYNRGRHPDDDNAVARLSAVRDAFEDTGIVADDRHIRIGRVTFTQVPRTDDPVARVMLEKV